MSGHLEGLVAHKDVAIQGEAELTAFEKALVCLGMPAVCTQATGLSPTSQPFEAAQIL